jgi:hypothetical protein
MMRCCRAMILPIFLSIIYSTFASAQEKPIAASKDDVLAKLRNELQYRSEWCPCSAANEDFVELDVRED